MIITPANAETAAVATMVAARDAGPTATTAADAAGTRTKDGEITGGIDTMTGARAETATMTARAAKDEAEEGTGMAAQAGNHAEAGAAGTGDGAANDAP